MVIADISVQENKQRRFCQFCHIASIKSHKGPQTYGNPKEKAQSCLVNGFITFPAI